MKTFFIFIISLIPLIAKCQDSNQTSMKRLPNELLISADFLVVYLKINPINTNNVEAIVTIHNTSKRPIFLLRRGLPSNNLSAYIFHVIDPEIHNLEDHGLQDHNGLLFNFQPSRGEKLPDEIENAGLVGLNSNEEQSYVCNLATNFKFDKNTKYRVVYSVAMPLIQPDDRKQLFQFSEQHQREIPVYFNIGSEYVYFEFSKDH